MNIQTPAGSARILEFPKRGRFAERGRVGLSAGGGAGSVVPPVIHGGSWYHDAAIEEMREASKLDGAKGKN